MKKSELVQFVREEIKHLTESINVKLSDINFDDHHVGRSIVLPSPTQADARIEVRDFQKNKVEDWKTEWKKHWGDTTFAFDPKEPWFNIIKPINNSKYDSWVKKSIEARSQMR